MEYSSDSMASWASFIYLILIIHFNTDYHKNQSEDKNNGHYNQAHI